MVVSKYHIAFSFAGEDREYVDRVASHLREHGVDVFYDKFEETKLWGKDLYSYLIDIYQNKALFTVMFVSEAYRDKLWTNHERKAAQARAFSKSQEYILPAMFDESVEIPGLLRTTGYISLRDLPPEDFADKVIKKLKESGVVLEVDEKFSYSDEAKADIDFPLSTGSAVSDILKKLKSCDWYAQKPAVNKILKLDWDSIGADDIFVLGRNIYQCACGGEHRAEGLLENLRREMASFPQDVAEHLINGMYYEVYFDSKGKFRGRNLKGQCLGPLLALQSVKKFGDCVRFIRRVLHPYRESLAILPNENPQAIQVSVSVAKKDPPVIKDIVLEGRSMLVDAEEDEVSYSGMWKLSYREFSLDTLKECLSREWHVPLDQMEFKSSARYHDSTKFRLPEGQTIGYPCSG